MFEEIFYDFIIEFILKMKGHHNQRIQLEDSLK